MACPSAAASIVCGRASACASAAASRCTISWHRKRACCFSGSALPLPSLYCAQLLSHASWPLLAFQLLLLLLLLFCDTSAHRSNCSLHTLRCYH